MQVGYSGTNVTFPTQNQGLLRMFISGIDRNCSRDILCTKSVELFSKPPTSVRASSNINKILILSLSKGDSGAPIFCCTKEDERYILIGIHRGTRQEGGKRVPGRFSSIFAPAYHQIICDSTNACR